MTVTLTIDMTPEEMQKVINDLVYSMKEKRRLEKLEILKAVRGKVIFDKNKTPLEIQKEMRDEWD